MKMEVGTLEPIETETLKRKKGARSVFGGAQSPGGPSGGGGGPGEGGDGSDRGFESPSDESAHQDKSRILTSFLLLVVLMTFGGLIGAYVVVATNRALEWRPFDLPIQVWISTVIIALSSITYELGRRSIERRETHGTRRWLIATTVLGGIFVASQMLVWLALVSRGLYMQGNPYAGFFYILTAVHAVHVIGGIIALGATLLRSWDHTDKEAEQSYRTNLARSVGWYWHFMGSLWIVLFILLGFWK